MGRSDIIAVEFAKKIIKNRKLILALIKRDFKVRYLGSVLGGYWNFIHPIAMISVYTLVFSKLMKIRVDDHSTNSFDFTIYLCAGILPWNAFQEMVMRGSNQFLENASFIKRIAFPKEIVNWISSGSASVIFTFSILVYLVLLVFSGYGLSSAISALPLVIVLQVIFATGLGLILGVFNVFLRDIAQVLSILFQVWFWLTPIVYRAEQIPEYYRFFFRLNPLYYYVGAYQSIFVDKLFPSTEHLLICFLISIVTYWLGIIALNHFKHEIADEL